VTEPMTLKMPPEWETIKPVWDATTAYFNGAGLDADTGYALAMVTQELLENAVKYGHFGPSDQIRLEIQIRRRDVTIEVTHRVEPDEARLKRLDLTIQWIRGFQNPFEAYVERLKAVSVATPQQGESGLGLVRIAYEGQSILDFYVNEHHELAVSAVHPLRSDH